MLSTLINFRLHFFTCIFIKQAYQDHDNIVLAIQEDGREDMRVEGGVRRGVGKIENVIFGTAPNFLGYS